MDLKGKRYVNSSGRINTVKDIFENITIFDDGSRVDTRILLDPKFYTALPDGNIQRAATTPQSYDNNILRQPISEKVDPDSFFNRKYTINEITEPVPQRNTEAYNVDNVGVTTHYDEEAEKEEILRRNRYLIEQRDINVAKQANQFKNNDTINKLLEEEGIKIENVNVSPSPDIYNEQEARRLPSRQIDPVMGGNNNNNNYNGFDDPMIAIFKKAKLNTDFKFAISIEKKIPKLAYIELMEESCDVSIIDYLATEFTESILKNPSLIKDKIANEIRRMIDVPVKKEVKKESITPKKENKKVTPKASAVPKDTEKINEGISDKNTK